MEENVVVSAIIPVYGVENYIERCIESVVEQTLKEIEIIIVNDGTKDRSIEKIKKIILKDKRIKLINKENGGLSSARNAGINVARGKYIINIDGDDWIEKNYLKEMVEKAEKDNLDIVVSDIYIDYDNGKIEYWKDMDIEEDEIISNKKYLEKFLLEEIQPAIWNKLYKSSLYKENHILHPIGISLGEDLATTPILAFEAKRIGKINKAFVHYIQNQLSITKSNPMKKIYELIEAFSILESYKKNSLDFSTKKIVKIGLYILNGKYDIDDEFYKNAIDKYIKLCKTMSLLKVLILVHKLNLKNKNKCIFMIRLLFLKIFPKFKMFKILHNITRIKNNWKINN